MAELIGLALYGSNPPESYYRFETDSTDVKGNNNLTETSVTHPAGQFGNGVKLVNTSSDIKSTGVTYVSDTAGSLAFWVKQIAGADGPLIWDVYKSSGETADRIYSEHRGDTTGKITFFLVAASSTTLAITANTTTWTDTNWHHVAYTSNGSTIKIYVDSVLQSLTVSTGSNTGQWWGSITSANSFGLQAGTTNGHIVDDLAIWRTYVLTQTDINALFNPGGTMTTNSKYWGA